MALRNEGGLELSITTVSIGIGVLVTFLLWGVACAMYDANRPKLVNVEELPGDFDDRPIRVRGRGAALAFGIAGILTFISKSFTMIPEMPSVFGFVVRERFWYVIVSALILGGVVLFGVFLKRTEAALATPYHKKKRRRQ